MIRIKQGLLVGFALAGLLAGAFGCGSGGGGAADSGAPAPAGGAARLTASVESGTAARQVGAEELSALDVAAVDEHGNKVDEALGITGPFTLDLPWGHDYILVFADADGLLGAMVYGEREQTRFSVEPGVLALDLGQITIHSKKRIVKLKNPDRLKPRGHGGRGDEDEDDAHAGTGDALAGAELWQDFCAGCHGGGLEEGSAREIAEALRKGEGRSMPAFPGLVANAADIAAYLAGGVIADADGDGVPDATDQCPAVSGDGADGCPLPEPPAPPADSDGDGVPDVADACPDVPAATADGCPLSPAPLADADGDGVPDVQDLCPNEAGIAPGGCPVQQPTRPAALQGTCLNCHGDNSGRVACSNTQWTAHRGARSISVALFDEISAWATGGVCP